MVVGPSINKGMRNWGVGIEFFHSTEAILVCYGIWILRFTRATVKDVGIWLNRPVKTRILKMMNVRMLYSVNVKWSFHLNLWMDCVILAFYQNIQIKVGNLWVHSITAVSGQSINIVLHNNRYWWQFHFHTLSIFFVKVSVKLSEYCPEFLCFCKQYI